MTAEVGRMPEVGGVKGEVGRGIPCVRSDVEVVKVREKS